MTNVRILEIAPLADRAEVEEDVIVKRDGRWQIQSRKLVSFVR
jgi:hypothetical protein